jgi:predicted RNase H-like nuclease (RuvC/YqgF family)
VSGGSNQEEQIQLLKGIIEQKEQMI